jgi:hypothetical protein
MGAADGVEAAESSRIGAAWRCGAARPKDAAPTGAGLSHPR